MLQGRKFLEEQEPGFAASESVMKALGAHPWKGNVRELQSVITRGVLLAKADGRPMLRLQDLPDEPPNSPPFTSTQFSPLVTVQPSLSMMGRISISPCSVWGLICRTRTLPLHRAAARKKYEALEQSPSMQ